MNAEIRITKDGSPTLYLPTLNEHYHSIHGALAESRHVFIEAGLHVALQKSQAALQVLEIGTGTGLNVWLTMAAQHEIHYTGIEPFPPDAALLKQYHGFLPDIPASFTQQLYSKPHVAIDLSPSFHFTWFHGLWNAYKERNWADLIYMDAFAPEKQPELWTDESIYALAQALKTGGLCVSYCAKGEFRRNLQAAGLKVEKLPGPPGKREMIRAWKI